MVWNFAGTERREADNVEPHMWPQLRGGGGGASIVVILRRLQIRRNAIVACNAREL
jgi:hypothetical protein